MQTIYDWVTVGIFAALIILFLQRSFDQERESDSFWAYLPPAVGCAVANYLGNEDNALWAVLLILGIIAYIFVVLKPAISFR